MEISEEKLLVFDADVLIHFIQSGCFSDLKRVYPKNKKIILQKVYEELQILKNSKLMLDSAIYTFKFLHLAEFPLSNEMMKEFAHLTSPIMDMGKGESACMSYCKFTDNVVVSSNLKDVGNYCRMHQIPVITTLDLVKWLYDHQIWSEYDCNTFINVVIRKGGKLPFKSINTFLKAN